MERGLVSILYISSAPERTLYVENQYFPPLFLTSTVFFSKIVPLCLLHFYRQMTMIRRVENKTPLLLAIGEIWWANALMYYFSHIHTY
jgi:hypothetical protein